MPEHISFITYILISRIFAELVGVIGNDMILSIIHEIQVQLLQYHGYRGSRDNFKIQMKFLRNLKASVYRRFFKSKFEIFYKLEENCRKKYNSRQKTKFTILKLKFAVPAAGPNFAWLRNLC